MRSFLLAIILLSSSMACEGSVTQVVPAVMGDGASLVNLTVELAPGDGDVYVGVYPRTGLSTQDSVEKAVSYAHYLAGRQMECDVLVTFDQNASLVDGPSGGAALTVMTYALLENKTLRDDTMITGSIDDSGNVGPVGGLYEKAKGAVSAGKSYFITPMENFYEVLLLKDVESGYGIKIIEAEDVWDIIAFMTENRTIEQTGLDSRDRDIPELEHYDNSGMEDFLPVAEAFIDLEEEALGSIDDVDEDTDEIKGFFENEVKRQQSILDQGYVFSAANEAFLNYIDLLTIDAMIEGEADLDGKREEIEGCLSGIPRPNMTDVNFEWVVGADLRKQWAGDMLEITDVEGELLKDERFVLYNDMMFAQAWCKVARNTISAAPRGGEALDEGSWSSLSLSWLSDARASGATGDVADRLAIAEDSYSKGLYGAAIFDSVFVVTGVYAELDIASGIDLETEVELLLAENRTSLWGNVYQSHGAFLYGMNETATAYRTLLLAEGLDEAVQEMAPEKAAEQEEDGDGIGTLVVLAAIISTLLLFVLLILIARGVHGRKGYRKTYRSRKKKGYS